ncbi:ABC transporter substrate-binding protein [Pseudoroseomonas wenyumeiae]|uniref:ABC transporter substrate-binding protein n=1 Tax=Teichococcus wenyumeiae TaxID=2478470 RepID=A0A3A9JAJ3_9PROT|nr:ABC transporter substrate-binding protein [Pseudoroseomonas wenyumeiae]RKK03472.1 ABC transporter substrate-binding protein [Pseudoroseomonas wenyumeiae]RMI20494.1 ABC transporter substrate-binding protein [Pseudoroseomonas wenyumeiae]
MQRRSFIAGAALATAALSAPRLASAQKASVLRFMPQADLALLDPVQTTGLVTRNHGMMVFDTLYGVDEHAAPHPQMAEGHVVEQDGRLWTIRLREGLRFHDGTPVLARDCVASIRRWGSRDAFGMALLAATDELWAPDDRIIRFRLKRPFPLLPDALGKAGSNICPIMPERLAATPGTQPVTEMVGSGPYRFMAGERVPGALAVYQRFDGYVPRPDGTASMLAGPRVAHFERVEWHTMPDAATAAAALQSGQMDWWEQPVMDLVPLLRRHRELRTEVLDTAGAYTMIRPNHLQPPFDNPAIRRALMRAMRQQDYMQVVAGDDRGLWKDRTGFFLPGAPMASGAGLEALPTAYDPAKVRADLAAAGYANERVVLLVPSDFPVLNAMSEVAGDMLRKVGINLDYQSLDWGTVLQRLASQEPLEKGGWSMFCNFSLGVGVMNPAAHNYLRGNGRRATFGWYDSPRMEALRDAWFAAADAASQQRICRDMQLLAFEEVPFYPTGVFYQPTAYRADLTGMLKGAPLFTNLRRAS